MKKINEVFRDGSGWKVFMTSVITFGLAYGLYKGVIDNYLAEVVSMTSFDKGVSEFFRELPGLLLVFILAVFYTFSAETIYKLGSLFMLGGMVMQAAVPATRVMVILAIFVFSRSARLSLLATGSVGFVSPIE